MKIDGFVKLKFDVKKTDTKQSPINLGLFSEGVNCLVVFPTHFNPNIFFLMLLQISLLLMFIPALRVFLAGNTVAMVTYYVTKMITCPLMVGQFFYTMIVASSDKERL